MVALAIFGIFICLIIFNPYVRMVSFNIHYVVYYAPKDFYYWIRHKGWRNLQTGKIWCYCAPDFGGGKTLSAVNYVESLYKAFNDLIVWDFSRSKFVTQKVDVISNVNFENIPFTPLTSLSQVCDAATRCKPMDVYNNTVTCTLVLIDEASSELNSRSFKDNINPLFLKDLVTCRHNHISIYYTTQDYKLVDALLRTVTSRVIYAFKKWRLCVHYFYDPKELEIAGSYRLIKPTGSGGFFVRDKHFTAYDTYANVDKLMKRFDEGDLLSEEEIRQSLSDTPSTPDAILNPSRKLRKVRSMGTRKRA